MEDKIKIDFDFISKWNPKYDVIANDEIEYGNLVSLVKEDIGKKRTISKETFIRILNWKSPRVKGIANLAKFSIYEKGIADAHRAEENQKLIVLLQLYGIGAPVGSTILHFMYPNIFPIIDIRTAETLHCAGRIESRLTSLVHYPAFKSEILKINRDNPCFSLRKIDRALFAYHKIYLSPKLKQNIDRKEPEMTTDMPKPQGNLKIKDKFLSVFQDKFGKEFSRKEIIDLLIIAHPGTNRSSIIPSDYCYNIVNVGIPFDVHIFEYLGGGRYKYLGPKYQYTGPIYWKNEKVGKWEKGICQLVNWPPPKKNV
jgi:hypothetical protein